MSDLRESWSLLSPLGSAVAYWPDARTCGGLPRHTHARMTSSSSAMQRVTSGEPSDLDLSLCFLDAISLVRVRGLAMVWRTRADANGLWRALVQHRWPRYDISDNGGTIMKLYIDLLRRRRVASLWIWALCRAFVFAVKNLPRLQRRCIMAVTVLRCIAGIIPVARMIPLSVY